MHLNWLTALAITASLAATESGYGAASCPFSDTSDARKLRRGLMTFWLSRSAESASQWQACISASTCSWPVLEAAETVFRGLGAWGKLNGGGVCIQDFKPELDKFVEECLERFEDADFAKAIAELHSQIIGDQPCGKTLPPFVVEAAGEPYLLLPISYGPVCLVTAARSTDFAPVAAVLTNCEDPSSISTGFVRVIKESQPGSERLVLATTTTTGVGFSVAYAFGTGGVGAFDADSVVIWGKADTASKLRSWIGSTALAAADLDRHLASADLPLVPGISGKHVLGRHLQWFAAASLRLEQDGVVPEHLKKSARDWMTRNVTTGEPSYAGTLLRVELVD